MATLFGLNKLPVLEFILKPLHGLLLLLLVPIAVSAAEPAVAIIIVERIRGYGSGFEQAGKAEVVLASHIRDMGFRVIDAATLRENLKRDNARLLLQGDKNAARQIALQHEAALFVQGTATSRPAGGELFNTQMKSLQASVTVKLIRSSDAELLGSASAQAAQPHLDELQGGLLAIEKASEDVFRQLSTVLQSMSGGETTTDGASVVQISGLKSFQHLNFIMEFLTELSNVDSVELESYSDGIATLRTKGSMSTAALALAMAKKKFRSFNIEPFNVSSNKIDASVRMISR